MKYIFANYEKSADARKKADPALTSLPGKTAFSRLVILVGCLESTDFCNKYDALE
ncbi:MAG TPA: hypothetical protein VK618_02250 [Flavitalea sp.]|nr:hypothetical protein [Flavitalea sp.]